MKSFMLDGLWHIVSTHVRSVDSYEGAFHTLYLDCATTHRCFDDEPLLMTGMLTTCLGCIARRFNLEWVLLDTPHRQIGPRP